MFCTNIAFIRNTYNLSHCSKLVLHHILPQISSHCIAPLESSVMSKSWKSRSPFSGRGLFSRKCGDLHAQQDQPNLHQHTLIFMCTQMPTNHPAAFSMVETHHIYRDHTHTLKWKERNKYKGKYGGHRPPAFFSRVKQIASLVFANTGWICYVQTERIAQKL